MEIKDHESKQLSFVLSGSIENVSHILSSCIKIWYDIEGTCIFQKDSIHALLL